jgi:hypothetical protein
MAVRLAVPFTEWFTFMSAPITKPAPPPAYPRVELEPPRDAATAAVPPQKYFTGMSKRAPATGRRGFRERNIQPPFTPEVRLPLPVPCERLVPFFRIVGSLQDWADGIITDRELCLALRKAAAEVDRGGC